MKILYTIVVLFATVIGSWVGIGGGVIIKPILDFISYHSLENISYLSTWSVFVMSIFSIFTKWKAGFVFDVKKILLISISSFIGGIVGSNLFQIFTQQYNLAQLQSFLLAVLMLLVLIGSTFKSSLNIKSFILTCLIGFLLGTISSFLGIGGGPFNVIVFVLFFGVNIKDATTYSLTTIFFSQLSNLLNIFFSTGFSSYDNQFLLFLFPAAISGALIGGWLYQKSTNETIQKAFNITIILLITINLYNLFS